MCKADRTHLDTDTVLSGSSGSYLSPSIELSSHVVISLDGAIIRVPTVSSFIETAIVPYGSFNRLI